MQSQIVVRCLRAAGSAGSHRADQSILTYGRWEDAGVSLLITVEEDFRGFWMSIWLWCQNGSYFFHVLEPVFALVYFLFSLR